MASRRRSLKVSRKSFHSFRDKENNYLHVLRDYQSRVRRRDTLRSARSILVSLFEIIFSDHCLTFLPVALHCLHFY